MYESYMTVVGNVVTNPVKRITSTGEEVFNFRVASNQRRKDPATNEWQDGSTLYASVSCWRRAVAGAAAALVKGDPVIVFGTVRTNEYVTKEGVPRTDLELTASAIGPDLARCIARIDRGRPAPAPVEPVETSDTAADESGVEHRIDLESPVPA